MNPDPSVNGNGIVQLPLPSSIDPSPARSPAAGKVCRGG